MEQKQKGGLMHEVALAALTGVIVGIVFAIFKLPIPAPPTFAGIAGIIGIFLGFVITNYFKG